MTVSIYVENVDRVTTTLYSFTPAVQENLKATLLAVANRIAQRERASLAGHSKTGAQAGSVRTRVAAVKDIQVSASVIVGGRRAPYANLFERGFQGSESVLAHRRNRPNDLTGNDFSVRAYERSVVHKAHLYLNAAKEGERGATQAAVAQALDVTIDKVGLR